MIPWMDRDSIATTGVPSTAELAASPGFTSEAWLRKGPRAVIECVQEIPCDPCQKACPRGAITVGDTITGLPRLDPVRCTGCGACIPSCPGQAIFVVDLSRGDSEGLVSFPWEFLPYPEPGSIVVAAGRTGQPDCRARVVRVACPAGFDRTAVVTLAVPAERAGHVRGLFRGGGTPVESCAHAGEGDDSLMVCRCEEVTRGEIRRAIKDGASTLPGVRRRTRAGMGLCQGRTCRRLVAAEIQRATGAPGAGVPPETARAPVRPVSLAVIAGLGPDGKPLERTKA